MVGTAFAIWLGQSVVANELLAHTKGHGMGFGWVSFGEHPGLEELMQMDTFLQPVMQSSHALGKRSGCVLCCNHHCMSDITLVRQLQSQPKINTVSQRPTQMLCTHAQGMDWLLGSASY